MRWVFEIYKKVRLQSEPLPGIKSVTKVPKNILLQVTTTKIKIIITIFS